MAKFTAAELLKQARQFEAQPIPFNLLVSYTSRDECLVCTYEKEETLLRDFFVESDRDIEEFDRNTHCSGIVEVYTSLAAN